MILWVIISTKLDYFKIKTDENRYDTKRGKSGVPFIRKDFTIVHNCAAMPNAKLIKISKVLKYHHSRIFSLMFQPFIVNKLREIS